MATDNETLYLAEKYLGKTGPLVPGQTYVFRSRAKARAFAKRKNAKSRKFYYKVKVAKWGPSA